jgi:predicted MFS family arabinose efflux permease
VAAGLLGLLGAGSAPWLVGADALSFVVPAALLVGLHTLTSGSAAGITSPARTGGAAPWQGISLVLRDPFLRQLALAQLGIFATITCLQAVLPAAAQQRLGSPAAAGWLYAAVGGGNAVGAVLMLRTRRRGLGRGALAALTLGELLPLGALTLGGSAWVDVTLVGISGLASAPYEILAATELARRVAAHHLGQASAATWLFGYAGMAGGALLATLAAPRLGWAATLLIATLGGTAILLGGWARRPQGLLAPGSPSPNRPAGRHPVLDQPQAAERWNTSPA